MRPHDEGLTQLQRLSLGVFLIVGGISTIFGSLYAIGGWGLVIWIAGYVLMLVAVVAIVAGWRLVEENKSFIGQNRYAVGFLLHADDADARLIAAAPDLLAALKKLHEYAHAFIGDMHRQDIEAFTAASAAIAKAEGTL